jgi:hypothetical protein
MPAPGIADPLHIGAVAGVWIESARIIREQRLARSMRADTG